MVKTMGWYNDHIGAVAERMADRMQIFHHSENQVRQYLLKNCEWEPEEAEKIIERAKKIIERRERQYE